MNIRPINIPDILYLISIITKLDTLTSISDVSDINVIIKTSNNYVDSFQTYYTCNNVDDVNKILSNILKYILVSYQKDIDYIYYYNCVDCNMKNKFTYSFINENIDKHYGEHGEKCLICDKHSNEKKILLNNSFTFHGECINTRPEKVYSYLKNTTVSQCLYCLKYNRENKIYHSKHTNYKYNIWENILKQYNVNSFNLYKYNLKKYLLINLY